MRYLAIVFTVALLSSFAAAKEPVEKAPKISAQQAPVSAQAQEQDKQKNESCDELTEEHLLLIEKYNKLVDEYNQLLKIAQDQEKFIDESERSLKSLKDDIQASEPSVKKETDIVGELIKEIISLAPAGKILVKLIEQLPEPKPPE